MTKISSIHSSREVTEEQARSIAKETVKLFQEKHDTSFDEALKKAKEMYGVK